MKLTDNEIRDIVKLLEAGKPLPEKYRFLLFEEKREVELVWNGKTNGVCNVVLPFQTIEQVDEPRAEKDVKIQGDLFDPASGRQLKGWTNKLIWGDNKLILASLKNGPLHEEIEKQGGIKLIYIDPPFDVGADFSMDIEIGDDTFTKKPSILEELAYRDTWGRAQIRFIAMIYERLVLMRDLLADDGSIYVHCDWREGFQKARTEPLITLGSAPLEVPEFRSIVLGQLGESRLVAAIDTDIAGANAHTRVLDADAKGLLRGIHRRVATAILFESSGDNWTGSHISRS